MLVKLPSKRYYTIGEIAKALNVNTSLLRFWEKEFKEIKPKLFSGKRRYYDEKTINILKEIKYLLKDKGMTIKGVKKKLLNHDSDLDVPSNTTINTKNILKSKLYKISKIIKNLKK